MVPINNKKKIERALSWQMVNKVSYRIDMMRPLSEERGRKWVRKLSISLVHIFTIKGFK